MNDEKDLGSKIKLFGGDCLKILKTLDSESVDALVTDPPAGIGFMGKDWDSNKGGRDSWVGWLTSVMQECIRVLKPGAHGLVWALPRTSHWTATALENAGFEIRDVVTHLFGSGFPKSLDISKAIDRTHGVERVTIATETRSDKRGGKQHAGAKQKTMNYNITVPTTDEAKQWSGWGTALKPASEHWILVRKPISEKTIAENVLKWGVGGLNIDGCRIAVDSSDPNHRKATGDNGKASSCFGVGNSTRPATLVQGRFPANLAFSHSPYCEEDQCDIECAIAMLDRQAGPCKTGSLTGQPRVENKTYGKAGATLGTPRFYKSDSPTGASRFFYCAKVGPSERGDSTHPTMKSQKLMRYFCKLVTPPNGIILDPFMGSGSTGTAALAEGFRFIGIEKEPEYLKISESRIRT